MEFQESGERPLPKIKNTLSLIKGNQMHMKQDLPKKKLMFRSQPRDKDGKVIVPPHKEPISPKSPTDVVSGTQELTAMSHQRVEGPKLDK
jgi:hypothetical protein